MKSTKFVATISGDNLIAYITFQYAGTLDILHSFKWNLAHTDGTVGWHQEAPWAELGIFKISHLYSICRSQVLFIVVIIIVCLLSLKSAACVLLTLLNTLLVCSLCLPSVILNFPHFSFIAVLIIFIAFNLIFSEIESLTHSSSSCSLPLIQSPPVSLYLKDTSEQEWIGS